MCTILLAKSRSSDRLKAIAYVEQAVEVIKENTLGEGPDSRGAQVTMTRGERLS